MFSFFKNSNKKKEVPEWASFFSGEDYSKFILEIENYFKRKKFNIKIIDGVVTVLNDEYKNNLYGIQNLAQTCNYFTPKEYKNQIEVHFDGLFRSVKFMQELDKTKSDFEKIKKHLGVKIYPAAFAHQDNRSKSISKKITEQLYAVLVFDLPETINNVTQKEADKWGIDHEELFRIGKKNTRHNYPISVTKQDANGLELLAISTEHLFSTSIILDLETRPDLVGSKGCLIGCPTRHLTVIYPIENIEVAEALNRMIPANHNIYRQGPGSLTDELIWYYDGVFEVQPYTFSEGKIEFTPIDSFVQLLDLMQ